MKIPRFRLIFLAVIVMTSCSTPADLVSEDLSADNAEYDITADQQVEPDLNPDFRTVSETDDRSDEEIISECELGDGCFGEPCNTGDDCLSGICVEHMGDQVCSQQCIEECPDGFSCQEVGGRGPDVVWLCISEYRVLCRPCLADADCSSGEGEDRCLEYGPHGRFCGGSCNTEKECPEGYDCLETGDAGSYQCILTSGECPCSKTSVFLGATTICTESNGFGTCEGERTCIEQGLSACNALQPIAETCNGYDDNCDGSTDEVTCEDGNSCTGDSCNGEDGCLNEPLSGTNCDDENACTLTDHCEAGECTGTLIACDDNNPCTVDSCDGAFGCLFEANSAVCDDGDPCTIGDKCQDTECVGVPVSCECNNDSDCAEYEDDDLCNGTLYCDKTGVEFQCKVAPDSVVFCPESKNPCLQTICQPDSGTCVEVANNNGFACEDGDACTYGETCQEGDCLGGQALNCSDGNDCTGDSCDPLTGCTNLPVGGECTDGNACTYPDFCAEGICTSGVALDCDDSNPCTQDSCNPDKGCVHVPIGGICDDDNACTTGDHCEGGICIPGPALDCDDANVCTSDLCQPDTGCQHEFNSAPCNDGNTCTANDTCATGTCQGGKVLSCDDSNDCTTDSCNQLVGCVYTQNAGACDDLDPCTEEDACTGGVCVGPLAKDCNDSNPCTDDICIPMAGCSHQNNQSPCNDNNLCTQNDKCAKGQCVPGTPLNCTDGNPCTDDSCNSDSGCVHDHNQADCDDDNFCTLDETCVAGKCKPAATLNCNDDNPCTDDSCAPDSGCNHAFNVDSCSDGDACSLIDICDGGVCTGTTTKICNDFNPCTDDTCDKDEGCVFTPNEAVCSDGNACTDGDHCGDGWCQPGEIISCDDNDPCTDDSCGLVAGCVHTLNNAPCDDGDLCTVSDSCETGVCQPGPALSCTDDNPCTDDDCKPGVGCTYSHNDSPCDDGQVCTDVDICAGGVCVPGPTLICDDGNTCTDDSCEPDVGCKYIDNDVSCDDGSVCTDGDICTNGACIPGPALGCNDSNSCTEDTCDAESGCEYKDLADDTVCADDGNSCTTDTCQAGECVHSGDGWSVFNDHCYRYFTEKMNWADARADCQARGGELASIANEAENSFIHGIVDPGETAPWIGFNDHASENSWQWSDASPVTFTKWAASEPNNSGNEDCAHLYVYATSPQNSRWNDANCSSSYDYICEKP
jgi:hypothetical protein